MELSERQALIAEIGRDQGFVTVESLAERFDVTAQTIRRDIGKLCDMGVLRRRYGGAEFPAARDNITYSSRKVLNVAAKQKIAAAVADRIPEGASIAFGIGTTPEIVARALVDHRALKIFTNNLNLVLAIRGNETFELTIAGGRVRGRDLDVVSGPSTVGFFSAYKVDFGVFGVGGVDPDGTLLDFQEDEVNARQAMLANCRASFLVLDSSKFGRAGHVRGGHISQISTVFCERRPPPPIERMITDGGGELVICGHESNGGGGANGSG